MSRITIQELQAVKNNLADCFIRFAIAHPDQSWPMQRFLEALEDIFSDKSAAVPLAIPGAAPAASSGAAPAAFGGEEPASQPIDPEEAKNKLAKLIYQFSVFNRNTNTKTGKLLFQNPNDAPIYSEKAITILINDQYNKIRDFLSQYSKNVESTKDSVQVALKAINDTRELEVTDRLKSTRAEFDNKVRNQFTRSLEMDDSNFIWVRYRTWLKNQVLGYQRLLKKQNQPWLINNLEQELNCISNASLKTHDGRNELLILAMIFEENLPSMTQQDLKDAIKRYSPRFSSTPFMSERRKEKFESLTISAARLQDQPTEPRDYPQFRQKLLNAANEYLQNPSDADGKLRAESFKNQVEAIQLIAVNASENSPERSEQLIQQKLQRRELILLAACIICPPDGTEIRRSQQLKEKLQKKLSDTFHNISYFKNHQRISDQELLRRTNELNLIVSCSRELNDDDKENLKSRQKEMLAVIEKYITANKDDRKKDEDVTRAQHLRDALNEIKIDTLSLTDARRKIYELVYLLTHTSLTDLLKRILFVFGWKKEDLRQCVESQKIQNEALFGDIAENASKKAELLFGKAFDEKPSEAAAALQAMQHNVADALQIADGSVAKALNAALQNYKAHDELSNARVRNLQAELARIQNLQDGNEKQKQYILLAYAVVFKSGSTNLAKEILKKLSSNEPSNDQLIDLNIENAKKTLKQLQTQHGISDYAVYEKAKEINTVIKVLDWAQFRDQIKTATENYRRSGLGGFDGNFRAERLLEFLHRLDNADMTDHCNQHDLILYTYLAAIESGSTQLKTAILDFTGMKEDDLTKLKKQYGIKSEEVIWEGVIRNVKDFLSGSKLPRLSDQRPRVLHAKLNRAVENCLRTCSDKNDIKIALQLRIALSQIKDDQYIKYNLLKLVDLVAKKLPSPPEKLLEEIYVCLGISTKNRELFHGKSHIESELEKLKDRGLKPEQEPQLALYVVNERDISTILLAQFNLQPIAAAPAQAPRALAPGAAPAAFAGPAQNNLQALPDQFFGDLKTKLLGAVDKYIKDEIGGDTGKTRAKNLKTALTAIEHPASESGKKHLILLASAVMTGPASKSIHEAGKPTKMAAKAMIYTGLSERIIQVLQKDFDVKDEVRNRVAERLTKQEEKISILHSKLNWAELSNRLTAAVNNYQPGENRIGQSRKQYILDEIAKLNNIADNYDQQRQLAMLITAIPLIDSGSLKQLILGAIGGASDQAGYEQTIAALQDEFFILDGDRQARKNAMDNVATSVTPSRAGMFSSAGAAPAAASGPGYACPINEDDGWKKFKDYLAAAAKSILSDDSKTESQKTVAANLILELEKAVDPAIPKFQKFLLQLAGAVFYDQELGLKGIYADKLLQSVDAVHDSVKQAGITPVDQAAMLKKLKQPVKQAPSARKAGGEPPTAPGISKELQPKK